MTSYKGCAHADNRCVSQFCDICNLEFDNWEERKKHLKLRHSNQPTRNISGEEICNRCGKSGRKLSAVNVGRDFNLDTAYIWLCQYCRGTEKRQNNMRENIHSGEFGSWEEAQ